jgi:hypothetical protein
MGQEDQQFVYGLSEVLTDKDFSNMFDKKPNAKDFNWRTVEYVQSCIKDPIGIGKQCSVHFFAPLDETNHSLTIDYDYTRMPDELQLLQQQQWSAYCQKQCLKMCYYLQKVRGVEILQMKCEFLRDENSNVWLSYVKDITVRRVQ